jgi:hypothetical protein
MTSVLTPVRKAAPPRWRLGWSFALRVAGLPYDTVAALRCPQTGRCADEVLDLEAGLTADAQRLSDILHGLVAANEDGESRRRLLALRRQIFKGSVPADPDGALAAVTAVDAAAGPPIRDWFTRRERMNRLQRELAGLLDSELAGSRAELWRLSGDPRLRAGMQIASPPLDEQLAALAGRDSAPPPAKKLRRVERSVLSYLYRTACKTSPFSSFTGIAVGEFDRGATELNVVVPAHWHNYVRLNVAVLARIADAISADPGRRGDLPVVLSPGLRQDRDRVRYLRRWITPGDDSASVSLDAVTDGLFYLRRSGVLDRLTDLLQDGSAWRCADLAGWLRQQTPADPEQVDEYLSILLRLGILQIDGFAVDVHTPDPLGHLRDFLGTLDRSWADELASRLAEPIGLVERFRAGDVAARRAALRRLREALRDILTGLAADAVSLPQTLLYEDCRAGDGLSTTAGAWQQAVDGDLAAVHDVLPVYDMTLPHRIMFHAFFLARYGRGGRCDDLLRLVEDFHEDLFDQYLTVTTDYRPFGEDGAYRPEENWLGCPQLPALDRARKSFAGYLRSVTQASPDAAEIALDPAVLRGIGRDLADLPGGFLARCHFVQVARRPQGDLLVVNQSYGGLSFPFSRFTHCFDDTAPRLSGRLRAQAIEAAPPDAVFAEVTGGPATTNLNLHAQLTDYVVVCPGETSGVPPADQLPLADLYLQHDIDSDRVVLRSTRLGREVVPVYLGYLMPMALPQLHRTLLLLAPTSVAAVDLWQGVPRPPGDDGVVARPRVRVGDVVISRQSWSMPAAALPRRAAGATDAEWFLGWQRWRRSHALPARMFATVHTGQGRGERPKPQYLDCDSYLSLLAFEALLGDGARVMFREMLPAGDELIGGSTRGRHVTEFAIETFPVADTEGGSGD